MPSSQHDVNIIIRARDESSRALGALRGELDGFALRVFRAGAVGRAAQFAMQGLGAIVAAARGDYDALNQTLSSLPGGYGAWYSAVQQMYGLLTGATEVLAQYNAEVERTGKYVQGQVKVQAFTQTWQNRAEIAGAALEDRARIQRDQETRAGLAEARRMAEELGSNHPAVLAARDAVLRAQNAQEGADQRAGAQDAWDRQQKAIARSRDALEGYRTQLAGLTLDERAFIAYEVERMDVLPAEQQQILETRLKILDVSKEQARADAQWAAIVAQARDDAAGWLADEQGAIDRAGALEEELRTPLERFSEDLAAYRDMLGRGDITGDTFRRAIGRAVGGLAGPETSGLAAALESRTLTGVRPPDYERESKDLLKQIADLLGRADDRALAQQVGKQVAVLVEDLK